jgi:mannose-6-phosphate isomerase-like protein (cupin superfamily)
MAFRIDIEKATLKNTAYRKVLQTTPQSQLVLMSIPYGDDIHQEVHTSTTQFIRIESGSGVAYVDDNRHILKDGVVIVIPPGKRHYIKNTGSKPLKLYSIYSPPEHPEGLIQMRNPDK